MASLRIKTLSNKGSQTSDERLVALYLFFVFNCCLMMFGLSAWSTNVSFRQELRDLECGRLKTIHLETKVLLNTVF